MIKSLEGATPTKRRVIDVCGPRWTVHVEAHVYARANHLPYELYCWRDYVLRVHTEFRTLRAAMMAAYLHVRSSVYYRAKEDTA